MHFKQMAPSLMRLGVLSLRKTIFLSVFPLTEIDVPTINTGI